MKFRADICFAFERGSYCYNCFSKKNKNAILYDVDMTGYEKATRNYKIDREGYYTYLINYTYSGGSKMIYKGKEYDVAPGDLVFINCNDRHIFEANDTGWEFSYVHVTGLGVQYLYDSFVNITGNVLRNIDNKVYVEEVNKLHGLIYSLPKKQIENTFVIDIDDEAICCDISLSVYKILMDINKQLTLYRDKMPFALEQSLEFIKNNYNRLITLDEIADSACLSKYYFERLFEKYMGVTVNNYIRELRFEKARQLLESTDMKLIDVAIEVGYSDIQALNKLFKKNLGVTPTEYRKDKNHYV